MRKRHARRETGGVRFVTFLCFRRLPLLSNPRIADLFAAELARVRRGVEMLKTTRHLPGEIDSSMQPSLLVILLVTPALAQQLAFTDATAAAGLGGITASRLCLADLNADGRPDAIVRAIEPGKPDRYRVFLNRPEDPPAHDSATPTPLLGFRFVELDKPSNLPTPQAGDCLVFADLDYDGHADAIFTRYLDINNPKFVEPPAPSRTCWLKGNGDGTFGEPQIIEAAQRATTTCIAVGDLHGNGTLVLFLGNWYRNYGERDEAFRSDLLAIESAQKGLEARASTLVFRRVGLPEDLADFDEATDSGGRPTYGAMFIRLWNTREAWYMNHPRGYGTWRTFPLELNYGRRANRLWGPVFDLCGTGLTPEQLWADWACGVGLDGDSDRSGKYPEWLKERAKTDKRFEREDEKPFRSHGNTFDAAVGDIDNDGDFDLFFAEITHAWAGPSSDRSRFLVNKLDETGPDGNPTGKFVEDRRLSVDRFPADPTVHNWNQGDLFCELADFDHDGRLDLLLSSGDYPDSQRLRLFRQQDDAMFKDVTAWCGLNNEGSQQISLGDIDGDGDIDILVGQSFNRLDAAQIAGRTPTLKVYLNQTVEKRRERERLGLLPAGEVVRNSIELRLVGGDAPTPAPAAGTPAPNDTPARVNRDALGAVVRAAVDLDADPATPPATIIRQLIGIGGHAGKQHEFLVHLPLARGAKAERIEIFWRGAAKPTVLTDVPGGRVEAHARM